MPLLRTLTLKLKIKGKLTPPSSPTTSESPSSFEAVGRHENQRRQMSTSVESIESEEDCVGASAKVILETYIKRPQEKKLNRVSRFREELEEGD